MRNGEWRIVAVLSREQIAQDMKNAGFPDNIIPLGVAIALGESGGRTDAVNNSDPYGGSWGLWQINGAHFSSGATTLSCALDPQCATNYAYELSNGGRNWTPWGAYTNESYKQYMQNNENLTMTLKGCQCNEGDTVENILGKDICKHVDSATGITIHYPCGTQRPGPGTTIPDLNALVATLYDWIKDPTRLIKLIFGIVLIGGAIFLLISPQGQFAQGIVRGAKRVGVSITPQRRIRV